MHSLREGPENEANHTFRPITSTLDLSPSTLIKVAFCLDFIDTQLGSELSPPPTGYTVIFGCLGNYVTGDIVRCVRLGSQLGIQSSKPYVTVMVTALSYRRDQWYLS